MPTIKSLNESRKATRKNLRRLSQALRLVNQTLRDGAVEVEFIDELDTHTEAVLVLANSLKLLLEDHDVPTSKIKD